MADFRQAFDKVIGNEGGYGNDPIDSGGETYKGVSRKNYPDWLGWVCIDSFKKLGNLTFIPKTPDEIEIDIQLQYEVKSFYLNNFWNKMLCDRIESQEIANSIFDFGVNAGIGTSIMLSQRVVGVDDDGKNGKNTLEALNRFDSRLFIAQFALAKIAYYCDIVDRKPNQIRFFNGWIRRALK